MQRERQGGRDEKGKKERVIKGRGGGGRTDRRMKKFIRSVRGHREKGNKEKDS